MQPMPPGSVSRLGSQGAELVRSTHMRCMVSTFGKKWNYWRGVCPTLLPVGSTRLGFWRSFPSVRYCLIRTTSYTPPFSSCSQMHADHSKAFMERGSQMIGERNQDYQTSKDSRLCQASEQWIQVLSLRGAVR